MIRPAHTTPGAIYRREPNGSRTDITPIMRDWYAIGTRWAPFPQAYYASYLDGPECRRAYLAGVMARAFGVDLTTTLPTA